MSRLPSVNTVKTTTKEGQRTAPQGPASGTQSTAMLWKRKMNRNKRLPAPGDFTGITQTCESIGKTSLSTRNRKSSFHSGCGGGCRPGQPSLRRGRTRTVDSGFKRRHGRGREGTSTRKFSFSIDGGSSRENRRRCRDPHRDLQGEPTRLNQNDPDRPLLGSQQRHSPQHPPGWGAPGGPVCGRVALTSRTR
ncbi:hypothetical protein LEMLEM_LOCUS22167 [Lemmus lemmus]